MAETTEKRTVLEEAALDYMRRGAGDGTVIRIVASRWSPRMVSSAAFESTIPALP